MAVASNCLTVVVVVELECCIAAFAEPNWMIQRWMFAATMLMLQLLLLLH